MPPDVPQQKKQEAPPPHNQLTKEGQDSLLGPRYKNHVWKDLDLKYETGADGKKSGYFKVTPDNDGYSLSLIATRALKMRGLNPNDKDALKAEMDRIVALNVDKYHSLAKNRNFLGVGWQLKITEENDVAANNVKSETQTWKVAEAGSQVAVHRGERYIARAGSSLVIEPGGEARLDPGSKAFLAQDGIISAALPGSRVLAVGGEIHDFGAMIIAPNPGDLKVVREDPTKLAALIKSERIEGTAVVKNEEPQPVFPARKRTTEIASNRYDHRPPVKSLPPFEIYGEF